MALFCDKVKNKRKSKPMRLPVDKEFQQVKVKDLKEANNAKMFTKSVRKGNPFATERKIPQSKPRIAELNVEKSKKFTNKNNVKFC